MALLIGNNLVVSMHYKLTDNEGTVIDTSEGREPLAYLHGAGHIIPGLENALTGKVQGDSLSVTVEPAEGYGEINPDMIQQVSLGAFQGVESVEPGMAFQAQTPEGAVQEVIVKAVEGDVVTIDDEGYIVESPIPIVSTVSPSVEKYYRQAVERLTFSKTSAYKTAPTSTGTITFVIKSK